MIRSRTIFLVEDSCGFVNFVRFIMYTSVTILFICEHTFKSISIPFSLTLQLFTNHMVLVLSYNFNQPKKKLQWTDRQTLPPWPGSPRASGARTILICSRVLGSQSLTRCQADIVGGEHPLHPPPTLFHNQLFRSSCHQLSSWKFVHFVQLQRLCCHKLFNASWIHCFVLL